MTHELRHSAEVAVLRIIDAAFATMGSWNQGDREAKDTRCLPPRSFVEPRGCAATQMAVPRHRLERSVPPTRIKTRDLL